MDVPATARCFTFTKLVGEQRPAHYLLLVAVGLFAFVTNLGATRLWDVDEAIFSEAAVEMLQRGDLVTPYYNGRLFAHKPPLMYWCQIAAFQVFGTTEFAARLFSALFSIGTLLVTYELGRTLFNARTGLWAGLALAGCINFVVIARAATPDAHLTFFCTLAMLVLVRGTRRQSPVVEIARLRNGSSEGVRILANPAPGDIDNPWLPVLPPNWRTYALAYAVMAVATLVKGPVGIVIPTAVWGLFLLIEQPRAERRRRGGALANASGDPQSVDPIHPVSGSVAEFVRIQTPQWWILRSLATSATAVLNALFWFIKLFRPAYFMLTVWRMRPLTAILAVALIAGPWYVLVGLRTQGEFLREFFLVQNVGRASYAMDSHQGPFYYYLVAACVGTFPWCVLLWPAIVQLARGIRRDTPARAGYLLLSCWVCVWVGCFSLVATKLASYIVPAYPALAIGLAALVDGWLKQTSIVACRPWLRQAWWTLAVVAVAGFIGLPIATRILFDGELSPALIGLVPLLGAIVGWYCTARGHIPGSLTTLAAVGVLFGPGILGLAVLPIDAHKNTHLLGEAVHRNTTGTAHLATYKYSPPSLVFYSHLTFDRLRSRSSVSNHFRDHRQGAFLVTSEKHLESLQPHLPPDIAILHRERLFLKNEFVVLLGRHESGMLVSKRP